jgi:hypothetical protein
MIAFDGHSLAADGVPPWGNSPQWQLLRARGNCTIWAGEGVPRNRRKADDSCCGEIARRESFVARRRGGRCQSTRTDNEKLRGRCSAATMREPLRKSEEALTRLP